MAYVSTQSENVSNAPSLLQRLFSVLTQIGQAAFVARGMEERMHKIDKMRRMSDAELAKMGVHRDDIAAYVFRDIYYT